MEGAKKRVAEAARVSELEAELDLESKEESGGEDESKQTSGSSGAEWSGADE